MSNDLVASVTKKLYDSPTNDELVRWICESLHEFEDRAPGGHGCLLDLGCGTGSNLLALAQCGLFGIGLTLSLEEADACRRRGLAVVVSDASFDLPFGDSSLRVVVASHVLEHLVDPWRVLSELHRVLRPDGMLFAAIPNVVFVRMRLEYLRGRFRYEDYGILDRTHVRFFDLYSARSLFDTAGFEVIEERHIGWMPAGPLRRFAPKLMKRVDASLVGRYPNTFAQQFLFKARPR